MNKAIFIFFALVFKANLFAQIQVNEVIYFDYDKSTLATQAAETLEKLYNKIQSNKVGSINITGHTDADGMENYNLDLAKARINTVFEYFKAKGVDEQQIRLQFYGESKPIAENKSEQGKKINRRVEIAFEIPNKKQEKITKEDFEKQPQKFVILRNKDTMLTCNEGTILKIYASSLVSKNGDKKDNDSVTISVREYYKISDMLLANLSTTSNRNLLETGGMVNIIATDENDTLQLEKGKTIQISFPTNKREDNMQLFSGIWDNNHINWRPHLIEGIDKVPQPGENTGKAVTQWVDIKSRSYPKFTGGQLELDKFISKNLKYPEQAQKLGVQGVVYVSLIINELGKIKAPKVVKSVTSELDSAALDLVRKMPDWLPVKENGKSISSDYLLRIVFKLDEDSPYSAVGYKEAFEKSFGDTNMQQVNSGNLMYYVFSSTTLGWINCDRFLEINPKINFAVKVEHDIESIKIVFNRFKAIMDVSVVNGTHTFENVPKGEKITIVAIKRVEGKPFLAVKETETSTKVENELVFQPVTMEMLKTEMRKLDKLN